MIAIAREGVPTVDSTWECLQVHRQSQLFLSVRVDDIKIVGRSEYQCYFGFHPEITSK